VHIVQLANFTSPTSGGLRVALAELGERYAAAGHRRTLIVPGPANADQSGPFGRVITVAAPIIPRTGGYRAIVARRRLQHLLTELQPDVIELSDKTTLSWAGAWAHERNVPTVLFSHERIDAILAVRVPGWMPLASMANSWNRHLAKHVDAVVCASAFAAEEFERVGARSVRRIALGVDADTFQPSDAPRGAVPTLVCVGRLSDEKRPDVAVATLARLAARGSLARLVLVGEGPARHRLESASGDLPVTFTGHLDSRAELARLLAHADVVLAPCPYETFGLGALEALAAGTPVVAPDRGALAELIGDDAGLTVPTDDPDCFATAVEQLLAGDRVAQRRAARLRAEKFSWEASAHARLALFAELTKLERVAH
jgi:alpha-1,6-mannosyltransferase